MEEFSSQIILVLQIIGDLCPEYANQKAVNGILKRVFGANAGDALKRAIWFLSDKEPYSVLCNAIFGSDISANAVEVLQKNGYFMNGSPSLMKEISGKVDPVKVKQLLECIMWAYLDRKVPKDAIEKIIGKTKTQACSDAESILCMWINTVIKKHAKLPVLTTLTQHFFGKNYFRAVLYHFLHEESLLRFSEDPKQNAVIGLQRATELGIQTPFRPDDYIQHPLVVMCYLFRCAAFLSSVQPPKPPAVINGNDLTALLKNIEVKKKEVAEATVRVDKLHKTVNEIEEILKKMKRPMSQLARTMPARGLESEKPRPQTSFAQTVGRSRRVTWDIAEDDLMQSVRSSGKVESLMDEAEEETGECDEKLVIEQAD